MASSANANNMNAVRETMDGELVKVMIMSVVEPRYVFYKCDTLY